MRDRAEEIRAAGAEWVIVGNGGPSFAEGFREEFDLDGPLLLDPELRAYRAAGLRRGRVEVLSPRLARNALRALGGGYRQTGVQGDPWQLGGVFVIRAGGELTYAQASREAGDHAPLDEVLAALAPDAPPVAEPVQRGWLDVLGRGASRLLDPTLVGTFTRPGFQVHALGFRPDDLDTSLDGRRCLVTGANAGLGFEVALALADLGAEVVLGCRSRERGEAAAAAITERTGSRRVRLEEIDLSDLASVRAAGERLATEPLDVLVHNAGLLPDERIETADGLELTFATHVAGPFLLTRLLRPALEKSDDARVVWVSSGGMYSRRLQLDDPQWTRREPYDGVVAYAETKRAQVVLAELWAEELRDTGIAVNAMHPGWADTPGVRSSLPGFFRITEAVLRSPAEGADTVVWLAACPRANGWTGRFFFDREPRLTHWLPWTRESDDDRKRLWELCEEVVARPAD